MAVEEGRFTIDLEQLEDYAFKVKFDLNKADDLLLDEPPPLGQRAGPNAARLLAAAAANCLSASLMYCAAREDVPAHSVKSSVTCRIVRNEKRRLRVGGLEVRITVSPELENSPRMARCATLFEDFCVVTSTLREGVPVSVEVVNENGDLLHRGQ